MRRSDFTKIPKSYLSTLYKLLSIIKKEVKMEKEHSDMLDACGNLIIRTIMKNFKEENNGKESIQNSVQSDTGTKV